MSDSGDSGSSGLTDWALVNSQGELESSDVESNTSSIEVVGREVETEEEEVGRNVQVSRETSPECFELEQLMRKADADAVGEPTEQGLPAPTGAGEPVSKPAAVSEDSFGVHAAPPQEQSQEVAGACCSELLQSAERRQSAGEGVEKVTTARQLSQESDSHTSSESILSLSEISSLSRSSKSSRADSDSESDFVRLEKESSSVSSHESDGEELSPGPEVNAMVASGSSVGSGFNFLTGARASSEPPSLVQQPMVAPVQPLPTHQQQQQQQQQEQQQLLPVRQAPLGEQPPPPPPAPVQREEPALQLPVAERAPVLPADAEVVAQHQPHLRQHPEAAEMAANGADDGDTESSIEDHDEDDRIESEQSDDTNSAQADDLDQGDLSLVNDLGDLPVERGGVERHYIHHNNQQLNGCLNRVMLAVVVLAVGMGLGHWIGSTREHFSQMEIQLAQMKRLHQMQDEYVQCLARNDELLLDYDNTLQGERARHQEAMADLRDNNRELQEQLQDAQDQLERILIAQAQESRSSQNSGARSNMHTQRTGPTPTDLQNILVMSKLLIASEADFEAQTFMWSDESRQAFGQARQTFAKKMGERQGGGKVTQIVEPQEEVDDLSILLQEARQQINYLKNENAELSMSVGKMRYNVDSMTAESTPLEDLSDPSAEEEEEDSEEIPLPPPPNPIPPPPMVGDLPAGHLFDDGVEVEVDEEVIIEGDMEDQPHFAVPEGEIRHHKFATSSADSPKTVPVDVTLLQRNLTQERQRADMWHRLYLSARAENRKEQPINSSACLRFLSQQMNMSALMHYVMHWNLTGAGGTEDFTDLTSLVSSIIQLQRNLVDALPSLWDELSSTLHSLHTDNDADEQDRGTDADDAADEADDDADEESGAERNREESQQSKWSDGVKKLLNKTRGTLSNVSQQLQQTWSQVKDASRQLWPGDDSVLGRVASKVKEGVSKLSHKVHKKASRWFKKRSKEDKRGLKKKGRKAFQEGHASERAPQKRDDAKQSAKQLGKKKPPGKKELRERKKFGQNADKEVKEEELQKKKKEEKADRDQHKNTGMKRHKKERKSDKQNKAGKQDSSHGKQSKRQKKPVKQANDESGGRGGKKRQRKLQRQESEHATHHQQSHHNGKKRQTMEYQEQKPEEENTKRMEMSADYPPSEGIGKTVSHHPEAQSQSRETEFHTKAKDHSSHAEKSAAKARFKLEKRFQNLFSRIGSMGKHGFNHLDEDDVSEMIDKTGNMYRLYSVENNLGLPESGGQWLKCQFFWWVKAGWWVQARSKLILYLPSQNCVQYLAPWQLEFMEETRAKLESGECLRKRMFSCIDPPPEDEEDYYQYACEGDKDYERLKIDAAAEKAEDDDDGKSKAKEAHHSPKGTRESDPHTEVPKKSQSEKVTKHSKEQVNQTEEENAWYFKWVQGRDNLRAGEHKADWVFERAADRDQSRQREHRADWVFERAADRDERRQDDEDEDDEEKEDEEERYSHWKNGKRVRRKYKERYHHFKHKGRKHQHDWKDSSFKHHGRDFRQKYGQTNFCNSC